MVQCLRNPGVPPRTLESTPVARPSLHGTLAHPRTLWVAVSPEYAATLKVAVRGQFIDETHRQRSLLVVFSPPQTSLVIGAATTLFVSTVAASLLPAWRATRYDPAIMLRRE